MRKLLIRYQAKIITKVLLFGLAMLSLQACGLVENGSSTHQLAAPQGVQSSRDDVTFAPPLSAPGCKDSALYSSIKTLGELVEKLGAPDRIYYLHYSTQHDVTLRTVQAVYLHLGVDFKIGTKDGVLQREASVSISECYVPTDLATRKLQKDGPPTGAYFGNKPSYVDWTGFDN